MHVKTTKKLNEEDQGIIEKLIMKYDHNFKVIYILNIYIEYVQRYQA